MAAAGCHADREQAGSETNWLMRCEADRDCELGHCQCGVCAEACESDQACGATGGVCVAFAGAPGERCRLGFDEPQTGGLCSHGCDGPEGCPGDGASCLKGLCLPARAETPQGTIAVLADGRDPAGGPQEAPSADAGAHNGPPRATQDLPTTTTGTQDAPASQPGPDGEPPPEGLTSTSRVPAPECPCESELSEAADVPGPGDAPPNAYGRPIAGARPDDGFFGGVVAMQCQRLHTNDAWFTVNGDECVRYTTCDLTCDGDAQCPDGGSGNAPARCAASGACYLDCGAADSRCPDGMACVRGRDGLAACYWPFSLLAPECDAYCRQDPIPRECPNWCAGQFVACAPDGGVSCCEGLSCTGEGYCDAL